jgi:hypothetical protein
LQRLAYPELRLLIPEKSDEEALFHYNYS